MLFFKSFVLVAAIAIHAESSAVPVPQFNYANVIPQNIQPFARQVSVVNRALNPLVATPFAAPLAAPVSAPIAAPVPYASPFGAPIPAPVPEAFAAPVAPAAVPFAPFPEQYLTGPQALPLGTPYSTFPYGPVGYPYALAPGFGR